MGKRLNDWNEWLRFPIVYIIQNAILYKKKGNNNRRESCVISNFKGKDFNHIGIQNKMNKTKFNKPLLLTVLMLAIILVMAASVNAAPNKKNKHAVKPKPSSNKMQVEEPSASTQRSTSLSQSEKNSKSKHAPAIGLSPDQKVAFGERKEKMQQMITLITKKRLAIQAAKPEARVALTRELHRMILEQDAQAATVSQARVLAPLSPTPGTLSPSTPIPTVKTVVTP